MVFKASASMRHGARRKAHTSSPWSAMSLFKHRCLHGSETDYYYYYYFLDGKENGIIWCEIVGSGLFITKEAVLCFLFYNRSVCAIRVFFTNQTHFPIKIEPNEFVTKENTLTIFNRCLFFVWDLITTIHFIYIFNGQIQHK